jgi:hypothetical protein
VPRRGCGSIRSVGWPRATRAAGAAHRPQVAWHAPDHRSRGRGWSRSGAASVPRPVSSSVACSGSRHRSACPRRGGGSMPWMPMTRRRHSSARRRRTPSAPPPRPAPPEPSLRASADPDRWPWTDHFGPRRRGSSVAVRVPPRVDVVRSVATSEPRCPPTTGRLLRSTSSCRTAAAGRWVRSCHRRRPGVVGARTRSASRRRPDRHSQLDCVGGSRSSLARRGPGRVHVGDPIRGG